MTQNNEWWRGSVTYQIYPRSYQDDNGDGIGDLQGITGRLGYIADLGVDAIWLSPIFTSPMKDMGYDVSNYKDIDPSFGTLEDFDVMVARAHELGLKVIIDQVLSHSSDQHPFFQESRQSRDNPKADWYVWADPNPDGSAPNNWQSIFGGIAWEWEPRRRQYYLHNFLKEQPDLNFHNPDVQDFALDVMRFWLDRGVDGFRLDTVNFYFHDKLLRNDAASPFEQSKGTAKPYDMLYHLFSKNQPENIAFLERMRALLDEYEGRTMVGEVGEAYHATQMMGEYTTGKRLHMAYSFEMLKHTFSAEHFKKQIVDFFDIAPKGWPCWAFSNHDVIRHATRWATHGDQDRVAKFSAALLLALEGSVCLYQGEELGQTETELRYDELTDPQGLTFWPADKGRDGCRTPMVWEADAPHAGFGAVSPWLPIKAPQLARAVDTQAGVAGSVLETYRALLRIRKATPALITGRTEFVEMGEDILGFTRGGDVICVYNFGSAAISVDQSGAVLAHEGVDIQEGRLQIAPLGFAWMRLS